MMVIRIVCLALGLGLLAASAHAGKAVVVIANRNVPESVELARYYMAARSIPEEQLCLLDLPTGERMSRHDYVRRLRDPLLAFLQEQELVEQTPRPANEVEFHETPWITTDSRVGYIVSMYGVPVKIADTRIRLAARVMNALGQGRFKNAAAVDSELALLLAPPYDIAGSIDNPYHASLLPQRKFAENFFLIVATRLDGPDPQTVKDMIDGALFAERYGLHGRAYFDARGLREGPYFAGDYWIRQAREAFARAGFETELDLEESVWGDTFPMEEAAVYLGWYTEHRTGPFTRDTFRFRPGAVAYHIHSASARELRQTRRYWTGPLLARGAAASMGAVSEPFLAFTPELHIFAERLIQGHSLGDALYMSQRVLSWQMTFVGDPLYRPFRYTLDQQFEHLQADQRPEIEWAHIRRANLFIQQGRFQPAMAYLHEKAEASGSLVVYEKLAELYARNDQFSQAGPLYGRVINETDSMYTAARAARRWIHILRILGGDEQADHLIRQLQQRWGRDPVIEALKEVRADVD